MKTLVISVCTFKRPQELRALFDTLQKLDIPPDVQVSARIIDNDTTPSARGLSEVLAGEMPFPVSYVHEPEPGLSCARNRALNEAGGQDYLVFVDDDETVSKQWLSELWKVQQETSAQFVQGPVVHRVEDPADQWWIEGGFFTQKTYQDGAPIRESWTNNVLIDLNFVRQHGLEFDHTVRFIGGEDTLFFQDMVRAGARGVYAAKAFVHELQPKSRLTWKWGLARHYRYGVTRALCVLLRRSKASAVTHGLVRSTAMMGVGIATLPLVLVRGRTALAGSLSFMARSLGVIAGLLGRRYNEYARKA